MAENPFRSPEPLSPSDTDARPAWSQAKLAWVLPIAGIVLGTLINLSGLPASLVSNTLAWAGLIGGIVYTLLGFANAKRYSNALPHAVGGCATLIVFFAAVVWAIARVITVINQL